ncbi:hypothetical protein FLONG3_9031 [Fusarium longipes]|uniref:Rhodopsin domain-containing protein n=1 Tax=Fusarium longipes TaxID=694270 RepID=A0A395S1I2_9HYPO|nr:hypothetical protein FLONG3_9031 [Fusarium longipes]
MPQIEDKPSFLLEAWGLYALGIIILLARFAVRIKTVGWRGLQGDDFFSFLVLLFFTGDAVTVHLIYYLGTNIEAGVAGREHDLTQAEIREYELGSKLQLAAWYTYTALIWSLKGTMMCFFSRMTVGTWHKSFVQIVSFLCGITYAAVVLTISIGCLPYKANWQVVPEPPANCSFKLQNFLVTTVLNVMTDGLILCIPIPLLWKLQMPFHKKLVLGLLLSSGAFVIAAAITRVVLTLSANPSALNINAWGIRETVVGVATVNIPVLRSLFSKNFWKGKTPSEICPSYQGSSASSRNRITKKNISTPYGMKKVFDGSGGWKHSHDNSEDSFKPKVQKMADIVVEKSYHVQHEYNDRWQGGHRHARSRTDIYAESPV